MKRVLLLAFLLLFTIGAPLCFAQGGTPVFQRRYIPPTSETPAIQHIPEAKPIPQGLVYAGQILLVIVLAVIVITAARAWRESNVFGRQYRFRAQGPAERRFGGSCSGGAMAVIEPAKNKKP